RNRSATNRTAQGQQSQRNAQQNQRNAQQNQRNAQRTTQSRNGQLANQQQDRTQRGTSTAQRNERLNGLQSSTRAPMQGATEQGRGGANVSLNDQQRTQIRNSVLNSGNASQQSQLQRERRHRGAARSNPLGACAAAAAANPPGMAAFRVFRLQRPNRNRRSAHDEDRQCVAGLIEGFRQYR